MQISLKAARVNAGFTQKEAANEIGVNPSTLNKWERGKTFPKTFQLQALCFLYKIPIDFISLSKKSS